jgi:hypothetical protein
MGAGTGKPGNAQRPGASVSYHVCNSMNGFSETIHTNTIKMKKALILVIITALAGMGHIQGQTDEGTAIRRVIQEAYIDGIQNLGDLDAVRTGFHPDFEMLINRDGQLSKLPISVWLERLEQRKANPASASQPKVTGKFLDVDITGNAAVVKLELHRENRLIFTDYLVLYKFGNHWKIVSKSYFQH